MLLSAAAAPIAAYAIATERCARDAMRHAAKSSIAPKARNALFITAVLRRMVINPAAIATNSRATLFSAREIRR